MKTLLLALTMLVVFGGLFAPQASARSCHRSHSRTTIIYSDRYYSGYHRPYHRRAYYEPVYYRSYHRSYHRPRFAFFF